MRKQMFDFRGPGEQANLFQGNKGTGTPLGGPQLSFFYTSTQPKALGWANSIPMTRRPSILQ